MAQFTHFPDFYKNYLNKDQIEEIDGILRDSVMGTIWDNTKYCSMTWDIKVNLQKWED